RAGNIYVNRNQIGAVVGSQPFGGMGLSGTGPKAGGPDYVPRFYARTGIEAVPHPARLPGPTGEANTLHHRAKTPILCAGPGDENISQQMAAVHALGGTALRPQREVTSDMLGTGPDHGGVLWWGDADTARAFERALAARTGPIIPLITDAPTRADVLTEWHLCVDTTAAGGNAALLGQYG
ncbi:MAG: bifunctional proline dehydrogenase/L-glutamate gamma-semialdehyde dehydrogenase, partial [Pseudomonadota bacterium]